MSRIQAAYDVLARELRESEKPAVEAFEAKYAHAAQLHGPGMSSATANDMPTEYPFVVIYESAETSGHLVIKGSMANPRAWHGHSYSVSLGAPTSYVSPGTPNTRGLGANPFDWPFANDAFSESEPHWYRKTK
jgi:hypothetical protein